MSDNRLGIHVQTTGTAQSAAEIARLRDQIAAFQLLLSRAQPQFAGTLQRDIERLEQRLKSLTTSTVQQYSQLETFSIRAIAAMRGQADAIHGTARALGDQDKIMRAGAQSGRIFTSTIHEAIAAQTDLANATANHAARQRELNAAFGVTEATRGRTPRRRTSVTEDVEGGIGNIQPRRFISLADEFMRNQRGQMFATIGAALKDIGVSGYTAAAGVSAFVAILGTEALVQGAEHMGRWAEQVRAASQATGLSIPQYSALQGALLLTGAKGESADAALRAFARNLTEASDNQVSHAAQALHSFGISQDEIVQNGGNVHGMLLRLADAMRNHASDARSAAALEAIFGRSVEELLPFLLRGSAGIRELEDRARALGLTLDNETDAALIKTGENARTLGLTISGNAKKAFEEWQPEINAVISLLIKLTDVLGTVTTAIGRFVNEASRLAEVAIHATAEAGYIWDPATGMLEALPGGPAPRISGTSPREGRAFPGYTLPSVAFGDQTKTAEEALRQLRLEASRAREAQAAKPGGTSAERSAAQDRAELSALEKGLSNDKIVGDQRVALEAEINNKKAAMYNADNSARLAGARKAATEEKQLYEAHVANIQNRLKLARGDIEQEKALLAEWTAAAKKEFAEQSGAYAREMEKIKAASIAVQNEILKSNIATTRSTISDNQELYRTFAADMQSMVKLRQITPSVAIDRDTRRATQLRDEDLSRIYGLYTGDMTAQQKTQVDEMFKHVQLEWDVTLAELREKSAGTWAAISKEFEKGFASAFDKIGSGLEKTLTEAITRTGSRGQAGRQLLTSLVGGTIDLGGSIISKGAGSLLGGEPGQGLGEVLAEKLSSTLFNTATKGAVDAAVQGATLSASVTVPLSAAIEGSTIAIVAAIDASTIAAQAKPSVLGTTYASGGIVPSAAGGMVLGSGGAQLAVLHAREMVLPAHISDGLQNMIHSSMNFTYAPTMNGGGSPFAGRNEVQNFFSKHGDNMMRMAHAFQVNRTKF